MRITIVAQGDGGLPSTWSGIPFHLGRALEALGSEVEHVNADPPRVMLRAAVAVLSAAGVRQPGASHGSQLAALRTRMVQRRLRDVRGRSVIQVDTGFRLPAGTRYATLHDMTVAQARRVGWSDPSLMTPRAAQAWEIRDRIVCRSAAMCCTASAWTAESVVADYGVAPDRVRAVGFGTNALTRPTVRDWSCPKFLLVGREWERKNGPAVLAAFRRVRTSVPQATLTVVGDHPPLVEPGVRFMGPLDQSNDRDRALLVGAFEESTCLVVPSWMEPFGIVYLEAGAAGVPSIGTTIGGAREAIGHGGVLVEPGNEEGLVAAMLRLSDPGEAKRLGGIAREHASGFTWTRVAERLIVALDDGLPPQEDVASGRGPAKTSA